MSGTDHLLEMTMGMEDFASEWLHCDRISSYIARMVSHDRADSLLYGNLLSSALNELLETVFANHAPAGDFSCRVRRSGPADLIEISLPCDEKTLRFYTNAADMLQRGDVAALYQSALFSPGEQNPHLGLLEVAADYQAKIGVSHNGKSLTLSAEMVLEGATG